ncbi:GNAT family N-acetyltransferase [Streptomyces echinoruber]|uniref:BioF2-like acetyltransferase domain-containing protein n=1 Tax=Streptomyces echinoruber TaxID=68898 RepID=A0A918V6V0_9ACTN|nr:GNAT family N-acetyltransferase [Streptomyces echinoruber]GGZ70816.1 hypothetical protein GCM10010389_05400 [Streptomyces echinoruber]
MNTMETELFPADRVPAQVPDVEWNAASVSLLPERLGRPYLSAVWNSAVVVARAGGVPVGLLPLQHLKQEAQAAGGAGPLAVARDLFPAPQGSSHLFVGGCTDLVAGAVVSAALSPEEARTVRRALVDRAWQEAADRGMVPVALYIRDEEAADFAGPGRQARRLASLSVLRLPPGGSDTEFLARLSRSARRTVLKDRREVAEAGLRSQVRPAAELTAEAAGLVAAVRRRHGEVDHPRLVRLRLAQWAADPGGERVAFAVSGPAEYLAITFGCVAGNRLEVYETGLSDDSDSRHVAYVQSLVHAPIAFALERGITEIDLGLDAETPKTRRGATLSPVWAVGPEL